MSAEGVGAVGGWVGLVARPFGRDRRLQRPHQVAGAACRARSGKSNGWVPARVAVVGVSLRSWVAAVTAGPAVS